MPRSTSQLSNGASPAPVVFMIYRNFSESSGVFTTMNPASRRLIKVLPTDVEETARVFDLLLGDNLAGRKEHIAQHGAEYLDDLDVS